MSNKVISLTKKVWNILDSDASKKSADKIATILLKNREIKNANEFIHASLKSAIPDPFLFIDMDKAVDRIVAAIKSGETIAILGDYDVDGVSCVSLLINFFNYIEAKHVYCIPSRMEDGYGLSVQNLEKYKGHLVVAVDCGSSSIEELSYAKKNGIDVVVIDHHTMSSIPEAVAIVNPHRPDEKDDYKNLCAAGLVFICLIGINKVLRESRFYVEKRIKEPDLVDYLDLVALATVCDVMDLVGLNRAFVSSGIKTMRRRKNLGIDALISISKSSDISSDAMSFFFGPRLNASGRMSSADVSVKLLTTKNPIEARNIALQLDNLNKQRQLIEGEVLESAIQFVDDNLNFICAFSEKWHIGIIGIVAGRLKERFGKPTFVISIDENGMGKASCRSISDVDVSALINKGVEAGIISSGGGHAAAAGFVIESRKINQLIEFLKNEIKYDVSPQELYADCFLPMESISMVTMSAITSLEPFGAGNRHPKFIIPNVTVSFCKQVGKNHLRLELSDSNDRRLKAISFKSFGTPLGDILMDSNDPIDVLGTLSISEWRGEKYINFQLEDVAEATI
jgi:single-stranded-DNA-specific exonuclease